jgi:hypothetical protein
VRGRAFFISSSSLVTAKRFSPVSRGEKLTKRKKRRIGKQKAKEKMKQQDE